MLGHFVLPDAAWWEHYYNPLGARLPELRRRYERDEDALPVIEMTDAEIVLRRKFPDAYGYAFFVEKLPVRTQLGVHIRDRFTNGGW